ncbi:MAG TPA: hypothetical protein VHM70_18100 [Polyangiaceae bacterium]|nr:hypothetical protein [Polyangiaceae bacterium]
MFTANAALWVGVTVLVLVASLPAPGRRPVLGLLLTFVAALIVGSAAVHYRIGAERLMMPSPISERARYAHKKLANPQEKNVLVVDGGSFAARAINNGLLTLTLARMGYSTRVVHLGITASNHFERYALYQRVVQNLEGRKRKCTAATTCRLWLSSNATATPSAPTITCQRRRPGSRCAPRSRPRSTSTRILGSCASKSCGTP